MTEEHRWPRKSAGRYIVEKVPIISDSLKISEVSALLVEHINRFESIDYLYLVSPENKLTGVISIKELYRVPPDALIAKIHRKSPLITVLPTSDREEVTALALQHGLKAIPVVNESGIFLGVIPHDAITAIINRELREDILQFAGIHKRHAEFDNILDISLGDAIKHRLPWLLAGLGGGLLIASIINYFESALEKNLILAAFIPLVVYIADAVRTQLEAFTIRDLAVFRKIDFVRYFFRQFFTVAAMALILGVILSAVSYIFYDKGVIIIILGMAIIVATLSSLFSGLLVPYMFRKFKIDPANASGPIGTIIQDIISVTVYFTIASILI
ncbi:MAG: magnesium transporter [Candidatus Sungbacteria bacterium]|nr:magnesium transporter [Candidatus Sungbacteria bacterium]